MKLYMAVTNDEFELPVLVSESIDEFSRFLNLKPSSIPPMLSLSKKRMKENIKTAYRKGRLRLLTVVVDDDEGAK